MHQIDLRGFDLNLLVTFDVLMDERNVTRAAARLGRTQSAVSHALARLRDQVGDPLLVKQGTRMMATPFGERLIEDVRPVLHTLERALVPSLPFEPATSTRTFRVGILDGIPSVFPRLMSKVRREAPHAGVDWVREGPQTMLAVADGQLDVAVIAAALSLPEGVAGEDLTVANTWATFVRKGHPAIAAWGPAAWSRYPHVVVRIDNALPSPVTAVQRKASKRVVGARVPSFSDVAPLLARTDLIATMPIATLHEGARLYDLQLLPPPYRVKHFPHRQVWSVRLGNDPAVRWIRGKLAECIRELEAECAPLVTQVRRKR